ncbi:MAG TPA: diguanylate cyclase [Alkalispirochaeta sp.]|nr:diguanylate cyclase [Alkalispirochaeta sp.]
MAPGTKRRVVAVIVAIVLATAGVDLLLQRVLLQTVRAEQTRQVQNQAAALRAYVEELLASHLRVVDSVAAYVALNPQINQEQFAEFAGLVTEEMPALRNVVAAPDLTIRYAYPMAGNESIIGLSYYDLPEQLPQVLEARDTRSITVAGPMEVVQGGRGILGRAPVFVTRDGAEVFWGVIASWVDYDRLIALVQPIVDDYQLQVALEGHAGTGNPGEVFFGDPNLFDDKDSVVNSIRIPNAQWGMAAAPSDGWSNRLPNYWVIHGVAIMIAMAAAFVGYLKVQQDAVLRVSEDRLRTVTQSASDLVWEIDHAGTLTFISGETAALLGLSPDQMVGNPLFGLAEDDSLLRTVAAGEPIHDAEVWISDAGGARRCLQRNGVALYDNRGRFSGYRGVDKEITVRKRLEQEAAANAELLELLFRQSLDAFFFMMLDEPIAWDEASDKDAAIEYAIRHQRFTKVNYALLDQLQLVETDVLGTAAADFYAGQDTPVEVLWRQLFEEGTVHIDMDFHRADGTVITIEGDYVVIYDASGNISGHFGFHRDVTAQRDGAAELERYIDIVDRHVIISQTDRSGVITYASEALARISGYTKQELLNHNHSLLRHPDTPHDTFNDLWETIQDGRVWHGEIKNCRKDGSPFWVDVDISALTDRRGVDYGYMAVNRDITDRKELEVLSVTDTLTGLFNRQRLDAVLEDERVRLQRYGEACSVIVMDVDRFKTVNDLFGHQEGDRILKGIARVLREHVRTLDTVGRWGGEEFMIICPHTSVDGGATVAEHIRVHIEAMTTSISRSVTASFGVARMRTPDVEEVVREADAALYRAKENGRNRVEVSQTKT